MAKRGGFPGGMPGNMNNLMKQAQKMQKQMAETSKALEEKTYEASAGGGVVSVTVSGKKEEPEGMLEFRLKAFRYWQTLEEPTWGHVNVPKIDYQAISYYADPMAKKKEGKKDIDPEMMKTFEKLGIPLEERLILSG